MNYLNMLMLCLILWALITVPFRRDRILWALFLIGFSQIGDAYPQLGEIRLELIVGIGSLVLLLFSRGRLDNLAPSKNPINKYFYLFIAVAVLSVPFSVDSRESLQWLEYYFKRCWILFPLIVILLDDEKKIRGFIAVYLTGILWLSFSALVNYGAGIDVVEVDGVLRVRGATGILSNPNGLANTIVQCIPLMWFIFLWAKKRMYKSIMVAIGIISLIAVFLSGSRGGFYGLVACLFFIALFSNRKKIVFCFFGVVLVGSLAFVSPALVERYSVILDPSNLGSTGDARIMGLRHGVSMLIERPVLGVGLGCYHIARREWYNWTLWAHNHYGQLMGELGLLGVITWGMLVLHTVKGARKIRSEIASLIPQQEYPFVYYLCLAVESSTYTRLVLGMSTHSMHIFFWYLNAGLIVACSNVLRGDWERRVVALNG